MLWTWLPWCWTKADLPGELRTNQCFGHLVYATGEAMPMLQRANLWDLDSLLQVQGGEHLSRHRFRDAIRWQADPGHPTVIIKREWRTYAKDRLAAVMLRHRYSTKCVQEFVALQHLRVHGLPHPEPLALWLRRRGLEVQAALMVRDLGQVLPLPRWLQHLSHEDQNVAWEAIAHSLGDVVAAIHKTGLCHSDLFAKHILVPSDPHKLPTRDRVVLVDWQRSRWYRGTVPWRHRARDLGVLLGSLHEQIFPDQARAALLRFYGQAAGISAQQHPRLTAAVARYARAVRRHRKVQLALAEQAGMPPPSSRKAAICTRRFTLLPVSSLAERLLQ
jgi:tRNA A-37 threonylcarbamoyl transferase component Bud32